MKPTYVVHYSEIALKGKNRPDFVRMLRHNLNRALWDMEPEVSFMDGRLLVRAEGEKEGVESRISGVFGVAWFAGCEVVAQSYAAILDSATRIAQSSRTSPFKVEVRRSDKSFSLSSGELAAKLGSAVEERVGIRADLDNPLLRIHVDIVKDAGLVYAEKMKGPGGLPVGTSGRVMHLFSGGIDSPPAAWLLMKRGCRLVYLHFYLAPTAEYAVNSKVVRLVRLLSRYGGKSTLILVPFSGYQLATMGAPSDLEPSLFRRFMRVTAELLAPRFQAVGISTGDSLSQAASQTLWNLRAFDDGSTLPILRPLLAYDKEEVVDLAKRIGTYETSLEVYKDCCAIITRHPKTRMKPEVISRFANTFKFGDLAARSIEQSTLVSYSPVGESMKVIPLLRAMRSGETALVSATEPKAEI